MYLLIKPTDDKQDVITDFYSKHGTFHEGDAGLDLFCIADVNIPPKSWGNKIPLGVHCAAYDLPINEFKKSHTNTLVRFAEENVKPQSFYLLPRSSTGAKTPLRLSNSVGVIDAGYRGQLIALVDNISDQNFVLKKGERYFQICSPTLEPIHFQLVDKLDSTSRGDGAFGSTFYVDNKHR